ncbi:MAG: hypothetical protein IKU01_02520 [Bacteroidales bacterium]|nr:hypothetical protein [Bacteroidales bacterium]
MGNVTKIFAPLESGCKDGYVTDIRQVKGGVPVIYVPNKSKMPDTKENGVLYIIGSELTDLTVATVKPYNVTETSVQCEGNILFVPESLEDVRVRFGFNYKSRKDSRSFVKYVDELAEDRKFNLLLDELESGMTYTIKAFGHANGTFFFGEEYTITTSPNTGNEAGYDWVDLGLPSGTKWATCNVGASNPQDSGGYYAWGETDTKATYTSGTYKEELLNKIIGDISGNVQYDAATANWGGDWRMPTGNEMYELRDKCEWILTTINNRQVFRIIGPNGNEIFLPMAGYYDKNNLMDSDYRCYCWTGTESAVEVLNRAIYGYFYKKSDGKNELDVTNQISRYVGMTIRPVLKIN